MAQAMIDFEKLSQFQSQGRVDQEKKDMQTLLNSFTEETGSQQDPGFFQDDNEVPKKQLKKAVKSNYSSKKVKACNLSTNLSYRRYKQKDFNNASFINFIIDILSFIVQNFTPINLDWKLDGEKEKWDECILHDFTRYIYKSDNHVVLSNPKLTYQKADGMAKNFIEEDTNRINILKYKTEKNFKLIQYVCSLLYPKIYNRIDNSGIQNKSSFDFGFSNWRVK